MIIFTKELTFNHNVTAKLEQWPMKTHSTLEWGQVVPAQFLCNTHARCKNAKNIEKMARSDYIYNRRIVALTTSQQQSVKDHKSSQVHIFLMH